MKHLALPAAALLLGVALPAAAQERSDKTHLDDFAVPAADTGLAVQQLGREGEAPVPATPQQSERQVAVPGPPPPERRAIAQVSAASGAGPAQQVNAANSREVAADGISSPRDSRPGSVTRLSGEDRCDPGQEPERLTECQRILELRAAEFQAAEPPRLSAEQVLLAERGEDFELLATTESDLRVKLAGGTDPDPESRANQELAAIYLVEQTGQHAEAPPAPVEPEIPAGVSELLESLGQLSPGPP